jgi:membrane protein DedA with SNARE-associated domain
MASDANSFSETVRHYLRLLWLPLTLLFVFTTIHLLWWLFSMPPTDVLIDHIKTVFSTFGLPALFAISIVEAMLVIGGYFPGGLVIVVAIVLADSIPEATVTIAVAITGLFVGHMCNYILGKYGWHTLLVKCNLAGSLENAKRRLRKRGVITAFSTYWMSSVAAVLDTAAGVLQVSWYRFAACSLAFTAFWGIFFGALFYSVGDTAVQWVSPEGPEFFLAVGVLVLWMVGLVVWDLYKRDNVNQ